jgi:hypothetical protein
MQASREARDPLDQLAAAVPAWVPATLSVGGRIAGAIAALYVATDVSYDRTQVVGIAITLMAVASLVSVLLPGVASDIMGALAAGIIFFGGAMLWSEPVARVMPVCGAAALLGALMLANRDGRQLAPPLIAFFAGLGVIVAMLALVALAVEG